MNFRILGIKIFRIFRKSVKMQFRRFQNCKIQLLRLCIPSQPARFHRTLRRKSTGANQPRNCRLFKWFLFHNTSDHLFSTTCDDTCRLTDLPLFPLTRDFSTFLRLADEDIKGREKGRWGEGGRGKSEEAADEEKVDESGTVHEREENGADTAIGTIRSIPPVDVPNKVPPTMPSSWTTST